jgi:hypothetical protein
MSTSLYIACFLFFVSFYIIAPALAGSADISMPDISYYCYKTDSSPSKFYYYINVSLHNSGDEPSIPIDVMIIEDEHVICPDHCKNVSIDIHENKMFTLDWCTSLSSKVIEIAYAPSDPETLKNEHNSGSQLLIMTAEQSTPGFELAIIVVSIVIFCIVFRKSRRV